MRGAKDIVVSQASVRDSSGLSPVASESCGHLHRGFGKCYREQLLHLQHALVGYPHQGLPGRGPGRKRRAKSSQRRPGGMHRRGLRGATRFEIKNNTIHNGSNLHTGGEGIDIKNGASSGSVHHNYLYDLPGEAQIYVDAYENGVTSERRGCLLQPDRVRRRRRDRNRPGLGAVRIALLDTGIQQRGSRLFRGRHRGWRTGPTTA